VSADREEDMESGRGDLDGRIALVTGGSRGIGRAISLSLAAAGAAVAVNWRRDEVAAKEVVSDITSAGGTAMCVQANVDDPGQNERMVEHVITTFGPIGIFVSNAGVASRGRSVVDTEPSEFENMMRVHALGPAQLCRLIVPGMRQLPRGDIVVISSVIAQTFDVNGAPYTMAKAALEALAFTLAKEEVAHGIHVNIVAPGLVASDMGDRLASAMTHGEVADAAGLDAVTPFGHVCRPSEVADVVRFLVSRSAGYVTAQRIGVDGGAHLYQS
jgi:3-oxoacyl-[acyl-carrier protein] reductase